jgi:hypothetical protein
MIRGSTAKNHERLKLVGCKSYSHSSDLSCHYSINKIGMMCCAEHDLYTLHKEKCSVNAICAILTFDKGQTQCPGV